MPAYNLTCIECGTPATASRKDAKQCKSCRLLKILVYTAGRFKRAKRCRACDAKFIPLHVKDLALCGECQDPHHSSTEARCAICHETRPQTEGISACLSCVKDPAARQKVIAALKRGQRERREEHADEWAAAKAGERPIVRVRDSTTPVP